MSKNQKLVSFCFQASGNWKLNIITIISQIHFCQNQQLFTSKQKKTINDSNTYTEIVKLYFDVIIFNRFINIVQFYGYRVQNLVQMFLLVSIYCLCLCHNNLSFFYSTSSFLNGDENNLVVLPFIYFYKTYMVNIKVKNLIIIILLACASCYYFFFFVFDVFWYISK